MERRRGDKREHMEPAFGRGRRLGRIKALDRFSREIGLRQQRSGQRILLSQQRYGFPWLNRSHPVNGLIGHFAARPGLAYALNP